MQEKVLIYGKRTCPYTKRAREAYRNKNVSIEYHDVLLDPAAMKEMLEHSQGKRLVPVIISQGRVEIGFRGGS